MLELLVALSILVIAITLVWNTFSATVSAWEKGGEMLDGIRHGDFVMEQLVSALRSAAYFPTAADKYGFHLESGSGTYPQDRISWVTASSAFMPPDSPYRQSLHRIVFSVENNEDGDPAVAIRALPHLAEEEDEDDIEPWFVSTEVKGVKIRVYNMEEEAWESDWEDTNSIPSLVEVTLFMDPIEEYGDPVKIERLVEIPLAPDLTNAVNMAEKTGTGGRDGGNEPTDEGRAGGE